MVLFEINFHFFVIWVNSSTEAELFCKYNILTLAAL